MLFLADRTVFASGVCPYEDVHPKDPPGNQRIVIQVQVGGLTTQAALDTGGAYFILDPQLADVMPEQFYPVGPHIVNIRGVDYPGTLNRCRVTLLATDGHSYEVDVTAFIPQWEDDGQWRYPSIMGLSGCLDVVRFAVDPGRNQFYFGPLFPEGD